MDPAGAPAAPGAPVLAAPQAQSPAENALVSATRNFGFVFTYGDSPIQVGWSPPPPTTPPNPRSFLPPPLRAATVVGIPKISRYTDFFQNSVFLEAKGGALLYVQKSVKLGKTWQNLVKLGKKGVNPNFLVAALGGRRKVPKVPNSFGQLFFSIVSSVDTGAVPWHSTG